MTLDSLVGINRLGYFFVFSHFKLLYANKCSSSRKVSYSMLTNVPAAEKSVTLC